MRHFFFPQKWQIQTIYSFLLPFKRMISWTASFNFCDKNENRWTIAWFPLQYYRKRRLTPSSTLQNTPPCWIAKIGLSVLSCWGRWEVNGNNHELLFKYSIIQFLISKTITHSHKSRNYSASLLALLLSSPLTSLSNSTGIATLRARPFQAASAHSCSPL